MFLNPRFRDIAGFLRRATQPLFHPNFRVFPWTIADIVAPRSEDPKLIVRVISLELIQFICPPYVNVTDGRTTYDSNTALALRASCGKNL